MITPDGQGGAIGSVKALDGMTHTQRGAFDCQCAALV